MIDIYIVKIDKNLSRNSFNYLINWISEDEKQKVHRFHAFEDSQRSLFGSVLARYAIFKKTGLNFNNMTFEKNKYGKPLLVTLNDVHFNISHSGNWVVCCIDDNPVGIDVETIKPIDINIAERFFSKDEYMMLLNKPEKAKQIVFYKIWTLKESYIKAEGKGLSIPLDSFSMQLEGSVIRAKTENAYKPYFFNQFWLDNMSVVSVCSITSSTPRFYHIYASDFLKDFISLNA